LRTIAGLLQSSSGGVEVLGASVQGVSAHRVARRGLALVPEDRALFLDLTVDENLRLAPGARGSRVAARDRALDLMPALRRLGSRRAGLLSGGEQQMLALGRAIASSPQVLLLDEMSLGLAPIIVEQLVPVVRNVAETGVAVLLVEQHVQVALALASRAYVMSHGAIRLEAAASELAAQPERLRQAYLG
jgi:branched-chain amino acid transport system ATP-binding protein